MCIRDRAIYARLSVENSGKSEKVDVITNQIEICKSYIAIDLKSFYASVECRERNLDPLDTNLVVDVYKRQPLLLQTILFPPERGTIPSHGSSQYNEYRRLQLF